MGKDKLINKLINTISNIDKRVAMIVELKQGKGMENDECYFR